VIVRRLAEAESVLVLSNDERAESEQHQLVWQIRGLLEGTRKALELISYRLVDEERFEAKRTMDVTAQVEAGTVEELRAVLSCLEATAETLRRAVLLACCFVTRTSTCLHFLDPSPLCGGHPTLKVRLCHKQRHSPHFFCVFRLARATFRCYWRAGSLAPRLQISSAAETLGA